MFKSRCNFNQTPKEVVDDGNGLAVEELQDVPTSGIMIAGVDDVVGEAIDVSEFESSSSNEPLQILLELIYSSITLIYLRFKILLVAFERGNEVGTTPKDIRFTGTEGVLVHFVPVEPVVRMNERRVVMW